jgi:hypothetical protein
VHLTERKRGRSSHLESSFITQRLGMAVLAAVFPVFFIVSSVAGRTEWQPSISAYYWTLDLERNFFVGALCAMGVFLFLYKGYTLLEDLVLDLAGVCAVGIAFAAMVKDGDCGPGGFSLHGVFAVVFFACIGFICIFMSRKSLEEEHDPERKAAYMRRYWMCAVVMAVAIVAALVLKMLPMEKTQAMCERGWTFWCESFAVWAFAAFWYLKTRELEPKRRAREAALAQRPPDQGTA